MKPEKLECDQGGEFTGNRSFFKKEKIFFKIKIGRNKASFAEYGIHLVKTRLFRLLRTLLATNWPKYLEDVVRNINASPNSALGGLRPVDIEQPWDAPTLDRVIGIPEDIPFDIQEQKQKEYESKTGNLKEGDNVYVVFGPSAFEKGYDSPVSIKKFEILTLQQTCFAELSAPSCKTSRCRKISPIIQNRKLKRKRSTWLFLQRTTDQNGRARAGKIYAD